MCHVNVCGPPVVGPQPDLPGPVTGPHAEATALLACLTVGRPALLSSRQEPRCFPCPLSVCLLMTLNQLSWELSVTENQNESTLSGN